MVARPKEKRLQDHIRCKFMPRETDTRSPKNLTDLPEELVAELYVVALSSSLPQTCKYIHTVIKSQPPSVHARYLLGLHPPGMYGHLRADPTYIAGPPLTRALGYPICSIPVLEAMRRIIYRANISHTNVTTWEEFELPKRLFRSLGEFGEALDGNSEPLPLLQFLWEKRTDIDFVKPEPNSHNGYPLVRAVYARFVPLVRFLLDHGADPGERGCLAVKVAIRHKDLTMVKMLIEFEPEPGMTGKKRRREDRVVVTPLMLDFAVRCDARDIVTYLMEEKRCIPNMKTLKAI